MMARITLSVAVCILLLQSHFVDVQGAAGELGDVCDDGSCTGTDNVCDTNRDPPLCKIKQNTDCSGNTDQCVAGATCASDTCTCTTPNAAADATSGLCNPAARYVGGTCDVSTSTCLDSNAECKTSKCECNTNYIVKLSDYTCDALAKIGEACTAKDDCVPGADACTSDKCACSGNNVATDDNTECKLKAGEQCTDDTQCATNAECPAVKSGTRTCTCKSGFTKQTSGKCSGAAGITASVLLLMLAALVTSRLV